VSEPALLRRCDRCRDHLDPEDLFCANCGHEAPAGEGEKYQPAGQIEVHRFECAGCGASLTWEVAAQALRCAFCGREALEEKETLRVPAPRRVVPFQIDQARAEAIFRDWLGQGIFRPGDLRHDSRLTEMRGLFLPYWTFEVQCSTWWTADSNETPAFANASWAPYSGGHKGRYQGVTVPASGALSLQEVTALGTYDFGTDVDYSPEALGGRPAEAFAVTRKRARLLAGEGFEERVRQDCAALVPGSRQRNLKVNPLYTGATAEPVLLPVWIMAYEYGGTVYRFLVNGQTGQADGTAPLSPWRVAAAVLFALGLAAMILWMSSP
jgi:predicted RNA-binding Zn-ribbon protein involved in translation (DUF1610 family)